MSTTFDNTTKISQHQCRICGAPAKYSYFGVISCSSCKVFFKRTAERRKAFICYFDGQCDININNRKLCQSCRLAKCFKCGMSTDRFQPSRQIKSKANTLVRVQAQCQPERLSASNLLALNQPLLTTNQWTLLSNLFNCYKESQILPFTKRLIDTHNSSPFTYTIYEALVDEFLVSVYETTAAYLRFNDDLRHLSNDDRCILLRSAADNVTCMGGAFIMQSCHLYDLDSFLTAMNKKYGKQTMDIHIKARKYIDRDIVLGKLAIALFSFSENTCCYYYTKTSNNLTNPINILDIQNKYAELTWKYLLYRYDYQQAVKRFLNITLWLASMNILTVHAQTLAGHLNDIDSIIEQTEITLILDDVDQLIEEN